MYELQTHPSRDYLDAFIAGELSQADFAAVETHIASCVECCTALEQLPPDPVAQLLRSPEESPTVANDAATSPTPPVTEVLASDSRVHDAPTVPPSRGPLTTDGAIPPELVDHPRYRVIGKLGSGGMGEVYKAEHIRMERLVALKVISVELIGDAEAKDRFEREIKAAARLHHPNIVTAFDADQAGGVHFLVMEFVDGQTLARLVAEKGPLPVPQACEFTRHVALGLQHAFEHGMVHRDIKPQNLLLDNRGQVKILDFGLARFVSDACQTRRVTESGRTMGTPDYIAPEQARDSHHADIRSDIYSLGCTLYFLLTGKPPFPEGTALQKYVAHVRQQARPVQQFRTDVPQALIELLARMMAKDSAERFQTPAEVAAAVQPFLGTPQLGLTSHPLTEPPAGGPEQRFDHGATSTEASRKGTATKRTGRTRAVGQNRKILATAAAVVSLALISALGAPSVYRIVTGKGVLVIETDDPDVEVVVKQGGRLVTVIDPKTSQSLTLRAGEYEVELGDGGDKLSLSTGQFTLSRGGRQIVKVRQELPSARPTSTKPSVARTPTPDTPSPNGLKAELYSGEDLRRLLKTRIDRQVDWLWGFSPPDPSMSHERYSMRWTGWLKAPTPGRYKLITVSDEGVRLWLHKKLMIDDWDSHGPTRDAITVELSAAPHELRVDYFAGSASSLMSLRWEQLGGFSEQVIPVAALFHDEAAAQNAVVSLPARTAQDGVNGLRAEYFAGEDFERRVKSRVDRQIDWLWGFDAPDPDIPQEHFSVRWTGWLKAPTPGRYKLIVVSDDGVRLWLDDQFVFDQWQGHWPERFENEVNLTQQFYKIRIEYFQDNLSSLISFRWQPPGSLSEEVVPSEVLFLEKADAEDVRTAWHLGPGPVGEVLKLEGHTDNVISVAFSPDGRLALTCSDDHTVRRWDLDSGRLLQVLDHPDRVISVAYAPDGTHAISGGADRTVRLWDLRTGKQLRTFGDHSDEVWRVAFSSNGRKVLSASYDQTIRLFDVDTGNELQRFVGHSNRIRSAAISPDGSRVLSGSDDLTVRLWDVETGKELRAFEKPTDWVWSVAFAPDGSHALSSRGSVMSLWDTETGREVRQFHGHEPIILSVAISSDGQRALSGGFDSSVRLWNVADGHQLYSFRGHTDHVRCLAFSPDGRHALSGSNDRTVRLWRLPQTQ